MAGDWIKMEASTPDKPEVWEIASALDIDPDAVIGKLFRVWSWFDLQTENGNAPSVTKKLLDRKVGVTGFCDAMIQAGWMTESDDQISLPNFDRHNGKTAKNRALTAKRVAEHKRKSNEEGNADSVKGSLPREEKRREEVSNPNGLLVDSAADDDEKPDEAPEPSGPPLCPHQDIIALYHEILPANPRIRDWTEARQEHLRARWKEDPERQNLDYWRRFFTVIATQCPFLTGQKTGRQGRTFLPGLEWMVKRENFTKIREGRYAEDAA